MVEIYIDFARVCDDDQRPRKFELKTDEQALHSSAQIEIDGEKKLNLRKPATRVSSKVQGSFNLSVTYGPVICLWQVGLIRVRAQSRIRAI